MTTPGVIRKDAEKLDHLYIADRNVDGRAALKHLAVSGDKQAAAIQLSDCVPRQLSWRNQDLGSHSNLHKSVHSSFIHSSQK